MLWNSLLDQDSPKRIWGLMFMWGRHEYITRSSVTDVCSVWTSTWRRNPALGGETGSSCDFMSGSGGNWQSWNIQRSWSHWWGSPSLCLLALLSSMNYDLKTAPLPPTLYRCPQSVAPHANSSVDKMSLSPQQTGEFVRISLGLSEQFAHFCLWVCQFVINHCGTLKTLKPHPRWNHSGIDPFSFSSVSSCQ